MLKRAFLAATVVLSIIADLATAFTPLAEGRQAAVLIDDTVYVYGGERQNVTLTNLYTLDLSVPWSCSNASWVDRTSDAGTFDVPLTGYHAMWPSPDGRSFYVWGGENELRKALVQSGFNQYDVVTRSWSRPSAITNMPQQRMEMSAAWTSTGVAYIWSGYGGGNTGFGVGGVELNEVNVLDTRTTPFQWAAGFSPNASIFSSITIPSKPNSTDTNLNNNATSSDFAPSDKFNVVGGLPGVIGIGIGVLVIAGAILAFLIVRKPWRKPAEPKIRKYSNVPQRTSPSDPVNVSNIKPSEPYNSFAMSSIPLFPSGSGYGQASQRGGVNHQLPHADPRQPDYGSHPAQHGYTNRHNQGNPGAYQSGIIHDSSLELPTKTKPYPTVSHWSTSTDFRSSVGPDHSNAHNSLNKVDMEAWRTGTLPNAGIMTVSPPRNNHHHYGSSLLSNEVGMEARQPMINHSGISENIRTIPNEASVMASQPRNGYGQVPDDFAMSQNEVDRAARRPKMNHSIISEDVRIPPNEAAVMASQPRNSYSYIPDDSPLSPNEVDMGTMRVPEI
ncbi:hypothetical protein BC938DRAFT_482815 [Jimgerdemannia flammicorona]|uniref:Uncharacterized protein n=1 Tax=Jimgerdemannia flammicorona TaxID=994334 RepID=A0A433QD78_9FUNG|nr:hypothetical protein BC938DRAFT_482815 [Jimgerdemannia flammicorona]